MSDSDIEKDISEKINSPHGKIPMDKKNTFEITQYGGNKC